MAEPRQLRTLASLVGVQRARRTAAEQVLEHARRHEESMRRDEEDAQGALQHAQASWLDLISNPGFAPEHSRLLADRLVECDAQAQSAALRSRAASELRDRRQQEWQRLEAQVRSSEGSLRRLRRRAEQRAEEKRLTDLADRVTFGASRS